MDESTQQAPNDTLKLAKLIRQKLNVLKQVRELTRLQSDAIDNSEMKRLMNVLTAKTRLLRDLEAMDSDLKPFHAQDPDQRVWSSLEARAQCRLDSEQCQSVILEVMHAEKQCEKELAEKRDLTAARIDAAHCAAQARRAYAGKAPHRPQLDLSSD